MAVTLKVPNFEAINIEEQAMLSATSAAGTGTLTLVSVLDLANNDFLYLPFAPSETAEKVKVQSISGKVITCTANLTYDHLVNEVVTKVFGDQLKFYRAANVDGSVPADTAFTAINQGIVDINPQQLETVFSDPTGSSDYWYKFTHYNSLSTAETDLAACDAVRGAGFGHYVSINDIRLEAGFQNNLSIEDNVIDSYRKRAEAEVDGMLALAYTLPMPTPAPVLVEYATMKLAAGYLLCKEYGPYQEGESKEGLGKISEARGLLNRISTRKAMLVEAQHLLIQTSVSISGWPNSTTKNLPKSQAGGDFMFDTGTEY